MKLERILPLLEKGVSSTVRFDGEGRTPAETLDIVADYMMDHGWEISWREAGPTGAVVRLTGEGEDGKAQRAEVCAGLDTKAAATEFSHWIYSNVVKNIEPSALQPVPRDPYGDGIRRTKMIEQIYDDAAKVPVVEYGKLPEGLEGPCLERIRLRVERVGDTGNKYRVRHFPNWIVKLETRNKEGTTRSLPKDFVFDSFEHAQLGRSFIDSGLCFCRGLSLPHMPMLTESSAFHSHPCRPFALGQRLPGGHIIFELDEEIAPLYMEDGDDLPRLYALVINELIACEGFTNAVLRFHPDLFYENGVLYDGRAVAGTE